MLTVLKMFPKIVDGITGSSDLKAVAVNSPVLSDEDADKSVGAVGPGGRSQTDVAQLDLAQRETGTGVGLMVESMNQAQATIRDEGITAALSQMAKGLAQAYADRERPQHTGRLHRV